MTELTVRNFNYDYITSFYYLTTSETGRFNITPMGYFNPSIDLVNKKVVLDVVSGLLLFTIQKEFKIDYPNFIVPQSIIYAFDELIAKEKFSPESKMSISFSGNRIVHHSFPDDYKEKTIIFLEEIKNWFSGFTIVEQVIEKIDICRSLNDNSEINPFWDAILDIIFLGNRENNILLTDDTIFYKFMPPLSGKSISSEYFLTNYYENQRNEILSFLLKKRFIGLSLNYSILKDSYINRFMPNSNHIYNMALLNISQKSNFDPGNIIYVVDFLRDLALNPAISFEGFQRDATMVFVHLLSSFSDRRYALVLKARIDERFKLLPEYYTRALNSFMDAIKISSSN